MQGPVQSHGLRCSSYIHDMRDIDAKKQNHPGLVSNINSLHSTAVLPYHSQDGLFRLLGAGRVEVMAGSLY